MSIAGHRVSIWHAAAAAMVAMAASLLFLQEPGLGDDIHYWRLALWHHTGEGKAWDTGFHSLRWPVWGVCWALMFVTGPGLPSYFGEPVFYMGLGALLCFAVGSAAVGRTVGGWCCAIAWTFQPLLDPAMTRPMPDLSEGVWMGAAFVAWHALMTARSGARSAIWAAVMGLCLAIAQANRITGVFVIPVLAILTIVAFRARFVWLVVAGLFALAFVSIECAVYQWLTGDFLHSLHANMGAKGRKGTEELPLWTLPFRFIDSLFEGNLLKVPYMVAAAAGAAWAWRARNRLGLLVAGWFVLLFLEYSCGLQSLNPPRPLVRDGDRFLSSLGFPLSVLGGLGAMALARFAAARHPRMASAFDRAGRRPALAGMLAILLLTLATSRDLWDLGFVGPLRDYLAGVQPGTKILSHEAMRDIARLVSGHRATSIRWLTPPLEIDSSPDLDLAASRADGIWYNRKIIWTSRRKDLERQELETQPPLPACLREPFPDWRVAAVVCKDRTPDLVFMERRGAAPPPETLGADEPDLARWLGESASGFEWRPSDGGGRKWTGPDLKVPAHWRGRIARLDLWASANTVEAVSGRIQFADAAGRTEDHVIKPYLFPKTGQDFFAFPIPENAEACRLIIYVSREAKWARLERFRLTLEPKDAGQRR